MSVQGRATLGVASALGRRTIIWAVGVASFLCLFFASSALAADAIYWSNAASNTISFANLDGTGGGGQLSTAGATLSTPLGVAIDPAANKIYWANFTNSTISFANLDGTGGGGQLSTAGATVSGPVGVAIDPATNKIYWANQGNHSISFANLDGTGAGGQLSTAGVTPGGPRGLTIDPAANLIYWTNGSSNTISFANLDGTGGGGALSTPPGPGEATVAGPRGLAIDPAGNKIYWGNLDNTISSVDVPDGGHGGQLVTTGATVDNPRGVAIDPAANLIYWANTGNNTISFANLNGTGGGGQLSTAGATPNNPFGVALLKAPAGAGAPAISGGGAAGQQLNCSQGSWAADLLRSLLYRAPRSFAYQWRLDGSDIGGATQTTYTPTAPGDYSCRVTATNQAGSSAQTSVPQTVSKASPTLATNASGGVALGGSVHDTATIAGGSSPGGQITYSLYGPNDATCSEAPEFTDSKPVSGNAAYDSADFTPTQLGTYRWTASYSGDANNNSAASACNAANESVTVSKASPALSTNASAGVAVGGTIHDTATLAGGSSASGMITFNLYGPNDSGCTGTPAFTDTKTVSGNAAYDSADFTPTQAGVYRWTASYAGDSSNNAASSACNAANESVSVAAFSPTLATNASAGVAIGGAVHNTATLADGASPTGPITFNLYGPDNATCSGIPAFTDTTPVSGNAAYDSADFTPTATGTYRWTASYSGDANNNSASSACDIANESVTVSKVMPTIDTAAANATIGALIHDTATLADGSSPTGTITFKAYRLADTNCSKPPAFTSTPVTATGNGGYQSGGFAPTQVGSYRWRAIYSGDANNNAVSGDCNAPHETSSVNKMTPTLTTAASASVALGHTVRDTAKLTGHSPTGKITFKLYGPGDSSCSKAPAFTTTSNVTASGSYPSATFKPAKVGTYRWRASYSGDANNKVAAGACNAPKESVSVTKN
jgi:DNA-binding beta-propeller fold protein YncE